MAPVCADVMMIFDGINKWDLTCDRKWIPPMITSIQFGGVLVGALIGGQAADMMFAVFRFVIGSTLGSYLVVSMFPVEFIGYRWRPILTAVPFWATGVCFLALVSWLLRDWVYVHLVGISTVPFLLGWFIIPESIRWLTVKGRLDEAEKAVERVAIMNGKTKPANTREILEKICEEEKHILDGDKKYSYLDLYRGAHLLQISIVVQIVWLFVSASYYGFAFGVGKFSGNFYLNLFLMNILEFPLCIPSIIIMNRFGRRFFATISFTLSVISCLSVIVIQKLVSEEELHRGTMITGLSLSARLFTGCAWNGLITLTNEMYPTVIRNIGYGAANMAARVGGIIAPHIFSLSDDEMVPYIIVIVILSISVVMVQFLLPETLGLALEDTIDDKLSGSDKLNQNSKIEEDRGKLTITAL
ncbi:hypothetical protein LOTGIDRAFT_158641 [Lottia gigantea]|uniref:Major facilitator superfamily (MFS) profile domain-containing protein n=1 Tax=Lottia gigantea TaxID=225164 RepID=V4CCC8_LOTGI|nr:hypothetical protein LOTGIDRAFT_158641 [Lottia gigantea]ESO99549.1 hypothetical protein LOTGIDRAFT_158641 [Lottia gigantea]